jgi:hypothetical protein
MFDLAVVRGLALRHGGWAPATALGSGVTLGTLTHSLVGDADAGCGGAGPALSEVAAAYNKLWASLEASLDIVDWQMSREFFHSAVLVSAG